MLKSKPKPTIAQPLMNYYYKFIMVITALELLTFTLPEHDEATQIH